MSENTVPPPVIVNARDVPEEVYGGDRWGGAFRPLTPLLAQKPGALGVNVTRLKSGQAGCPFHAHLREDEVFYVLSGRGVLRYGEDLFEIGPGDTISCPANSGKAHQIANPYEEELVYLGIGLNDPHEVAVYPDSGKVYVRGIKRIGYLKDAEYQDGEGEVPRIFALIAASAPAKGEPGS